VCFCDDAADCLRRARRSIGKRRRRRGQGKELVASLAFLIIVGFACVKLMHALERVEEHDHREESLHREVLHAGRWQTFPGEASSHPDRLLLATHTRLLWFNYHTRDVTVLHEGEVCVPTPHILNSSGVLPSSSP
jgi:hypothetical protein